MPFIKRYFFTFFFAANFVIFKRTYLFIVIGYEAVSKALFSNHKGRNGFL